MPLDGLTRTRTLRDAADDLGIVLVSEDFLEEHKRRELAKHPGNLLWRHRHLIRHCIGSGFFIGLFGGISAMFALIAALAVWNTTMIFVTLAITAMCSLFCLLTVMASVGLRMREPARWVESIPETWDDIPPALAVIARDMIAHAKMSGTAYPVVGQLMQETIALDPYLTLRSFNDVAIIGVWDNETIIATATRIK